MMHLLAAAALAAATLVGQSAASKLHPPVLPLTVRNPYLSTWLQNAREEPWTRWPMFWTGEEVCCSVFIELWSIVAIWGEEANIGAFCIDWFVGRSRCTWK